MDALLALEDGTVYKGTSFGATGTRTAEVVFNTSMTGYQEILSDPSYRYQMVTMTYPLQGNYGVTPEDTQSRGPQLTALLVKELTVTTSNWRAKEQLSTYLAGHDVMGLEGIDTRALTRHVRNFGAMRGALSTDITNPDELVDMARSAPSMAGLDLAKDVSCTEAYEWTEPEKVEFVPPSVMARPDGDARIYHVVVIDCGVKFGILRKLVSTGFKVTVVPAATGADEIRKLEPDGLFLSNGPGDPEPVTYVQQTTRDLLGEVPIFGICLGHQILGLALGGKSYKLKFGHRGGNHPVKDSGTGRIWITAQNHGFCIEPDSLDDKSIEKFQWNLYDGTLEAIRHKEVPAFSAQYHPEASPGPHDALELFERFRTMIEQHAG